MLRISYNSVIAWLILHPAFVQGAVGFCGTTPTGCILMAEGSRIGPVVR